MSAQHPFLNSITEVNNSYLDRLFNEAVRALNNATTAVNTIPTDLIPMPDFSGLSLNLINPMDVSLGTLPAMPTKPLLRDIPVDQFPLSPILTTDLIASDSLLTTLIGRIVTEIESRLTNPTGLKPAVEAALWGRAVDRESKLQRSAYQAYLANNAAMGFESDTGQDQDALIHFETEKRSKLSDINRDIAIKQAELEQQNLQKTLDLYQSLQAQLFGQKQSDERNKIDLFSTKIKAVIDKAQLYISINEGVIRVYEGEINAYAALAGVTQDMARFRMDQYRQVNEMNKMLADISLEKISLIEKHHADNAQLAVERVKAIAAVNGQVGANWMNGINLSQSWSTGKSWHYGESLSA